MRAARALALVAVLAPWAPASLANPGACASADATALASSADVAVEGELGPRETLAWTVEAVVDDTFAIEVRLPPGARGDAYFLSPSGETVALRHVFGPILGGTVRLAGEPGTWRYCIESLEESPQGYEARLVHAPPMTPVPPRAGAITVAVLDTGIDPRHEDLQGARVVAWRDFAGDASGRGHSTPYDDMGHGTAVASLAVRGVPDAEVVVAKVFSQNQRATWSTIAEATRWALATASVDVLVLSIEDHSVLGPPTALESGLFEALAEAHAAGTVIVAANGNGGGHPGSLHPPTSSPHVLAVGSATAWGAPSGFNDLEPNVLALGEDVCAARAAGTFAAVENGACPGPRRGATTGTSFAAPQVAAWAARLRAARPDASPETLGKWLLASARDDALTPYAREGFGVLDEGGFALAQEHAGNAESFDWSSTRLDSRLAYRQSLLVKAVVSGPR